MIRKAIFLLLIVLCASCNTQRSRMKVLDFRLEKSKDTISQLLDQWHKAAADADFDAYFSKMTDDAIFIGTDATENWKNDEFKKFSKPYFDKGKAWNFTALERNVFISQYGDIAWFDELLDTQMELCRGSGVLKRKDGTWKIAHYVLSIAVPNDEVTKVVALKRKNDSLFKAEMKNPK